jgi:muramoyltetrapeptide carboxypeptidase
MNQNTRPDQPSQGNKITKPKTLKPGDRIALIAPASPVDADQLETAMRSVFFMGLRPVLFPSATMSHGYLSGPDHVRAADVNNAFADPDIDGIFCLRGGYGVTRILNEIDFFMIRENPKLFLGYSDITGLHIALNQLSNLATLHAPMPARGWSSLDPITLGSLTENLFSPLPVCLIPPIEGEPIETIYPGTATGPVVGGNLSLVAATLGSPYEIDTKGKIIFLEEVDEKHYKVDRNLTSLALAGKFSDCAGIILGTWSNVEDPDLEPERNLTLCQIFSEVIRPFEKPTINNFRAGHIYPQICIPLGATTRLDATNGTVEFLEAATN